MKKMAMNPSSLTRKYSNMFDLRIVCHIRPAFLVVLTALSGCYATERTVIDLKAPVGGQQVSPKASNQVNQPSTQANAPIKKTRKVDSNFGLTPISTKPSIPAAAAKNICEPQARAAGNQAERDFKPANTAYSANCRRDYFGNYNCTGSSRITGGFAGGVLAAMEASSVKREVSRATYLECLSRYGWTKNY